jgi:UDP-GlcNAc:undecaprenyl-phosphate GlcNAc-1-phosphate transferase
MINLALTAFLLAFGLGLVGAPLWKSLAQRFDLLDRPDQTRKFQLGPIPLTGGYMLWVSMAGGALWVATQTEVLAGALNIQQVMGWLLAGLVLVGGGYLDDRLALRARYAVIAPLIAALILVASGVGFQVLTNPFGGVLNIPVVFGVVATMAWVLLLTYVTKLLDGADGLAGGVSFLGVATIATLALSRDYYQPDVALLSAVVLGAIAAFLVFNVPPARQYLGEGGSTLLGLTLAFLSVAGGSKAATVALVAIVPLVDLFLVMVRRLVRGRPIFSADRSHLHHLLLDSGLSKLGVLAVYLGTSLLFGVIALFATSLMKIVALLALAFVTAVVILALDDKLSRRV